MSENAIPKIEGHAAFYTHLKSGQVDKAQMIGLENDRFVEKILIGRKYYEAPVVTSRICGICPTIHSTTSVKAIEAAIGVKPSGQTILFRKLLLAGQMIQSHSLHLYLLVLPDFVGASSSFELQKDHPDLFQSAIILKRYADRIIEVIGGRAVHPIANVPGGFKSFPRKEELKELLEMSKEALATSEKTLRLFSTLKYPEMEHDFISSALENCGEYGLYDGQVTDSSGNTYQPDDYKKYIIEELRPYTRAKFGTIHGKEMMVGSLARLNLHGEKLHPEVWELAKECGVEYKKSQNPFDNTMAQVLENYHYTIDTIRLIEFFIKEGIDASDPVKPPRVFGTGTSACEAPRGTLFHHYEIDNEGYITKVDLITPTVQNLPVMELSMKHLGPILENETPEEQLKTTEMLIRAYDPCITCATH